MFFSHFLGQRVPHFPGRRVSGTQWPPSSMGAEFGFAQQFAGGPHDGFPGWFNPFEFNEQGFNPFGFAQQTQEEAPQRPATSADALRKLPTITVTEHDLNPQEDATCSICLSTFARGDSAVRMPCGHLFHGDCIKEWLSNSNQCAVCRWELPTDDAQHERGRQVSSQKLRLRLSELQRRTVREVQFLASNLRVDTRGCIEKSDLVERILASGRVNIAPEVAQPEPRKTSADLSVDALMQQEDDPSAAPSAEIAQTLAAQPEPSSTLADPSVNVLLQQKEDSSAAPSPDLAKEQVDPSADALYQHKDTHPNTLGDLFADVPMQQEENASAAPTAVLLCLQDANSTIELSPKTGATGSFSF